MTKVTVKFYFDFISPYAWLAWRPMMNLVQKYSLSDNPIKIVFQPIPILFAGLLNHHGQLGPAEIPSKKSFILKDVARRAKLQNLLVNPPPTHPFNPLLPLRIASLDMPSPELKNKLIGDVLDAAWKDGKDISNENTIREIFRKLELNEDTYLRLANESINKDRLRDQTNKAIENGVFGVPTTLVNNELFWGSELETFQMIEYTIQDDPIAKIDPSVVERWDNLKKSADRRQRK